MINSLCSHNVQLSFVIIIVTITEKWKIKYKRKSKAYFFFVHCKCASIECWNLDNGREDKGPRRIKLLTEHCFVRFVYISAKRLASFSVLKQKILMREWWIIFFKSFMRHCKSIKCTKYSLFIIVLLNSIGITVTSNHPSISIYTHTNYTHTNEIFLVSVVTNEKLIKQPFVCCVCLRCYILLNPNIITKDIHIEQAIHVQTSIQKPK